MTYFENAHTGDRAQALRTDNGEVEVNVVVNGEVGTGDLYLDRATAVGLAVVILQEVMALEETVRDAPDMVVATLRETLADAHQQPSDRAILATLLEHLRLRAEAL